MLLNGMTALAPLLSAWIIVELDRRTSTTTDVPQDTSSGTPDVTWTFKFQVHSLYLIERQMCPLGLSVRGHNSRRTIRRLRVMLVCANVSARELLEHVAVQGVL